MSRRREADGVDEDVRAGLGLGLDGGEGNLPQLGHPVGGVREAGLLVGPCLGELHEAVDELVDGGGGFGGGEGVADVLGAVGDGDGADAAGDVDDAGAGGEEWEEGLADGLGAEVVGGVGDGGLLGEGRRGRGLVGNAGVVDEDIQMAVLLLQEVAGRQGKARDEARWGRTGVDGNCRAVMLAWLVMSSW